MGQESGHVCGTGGSGVFGPAFIEAHRLESTIAIYPRIVVSPDALEAERIVPELRHPFNAQQHLRDVMGLLAQGDDGVWFVDYLGAPDRPNEATLVKHRDLIVSQRSQYKTMSHVALKYDWLALYYNRTVQRFPGLGGNDLRVPFP